MNKEHKPCLYRKIGQLENHKNKNAYQLELSVVRDYMIRKGIKRVEKYVYEYWYKGMNIDIQNNANNHRHKFKISSKQKSTYLVKKNI